MYRFGYDFQRFLRVCGGAIQGFLLFCEKANRLGGFGLFVMAVVAKMVDYRWLKKWALIVLIVAFILNIITPFIGFAAGGATRQLKFGSVNFQPSEIMKFAIILFFSAYISNNHAQIHTLRKGVFPFVGIGLLAAVRLSFKSTCRRLLSPACLCLL
jgi:cell division protein FtsW